MIGKIAVIKSLIIPNLIYIASNMVIPNDILQKFKNIIYTFIWNGKKDRIKRSVLCSDILDGGLNMIDIDKYIEAIKIKWILKLQESKVEKDNWSIIPNFYFNKFGKNLLIFEMNIKSIKMLEKHIFNTLPLFYQNLIKTWVSVKGGQSKNPTDFLTIRKELIWGNQNIQVNNKSLFFNNWIKSDILYVNDIIDEKGQISERIILNKLKNKQNWISEFHKICTAIPKHWKNILSEESSFKTNVKINRKQNLKIFYTCYLTNDMCNKDIYKILQTNRNKDKPLGLLLWNKILQKNYRTVDTFKFIKQYVELHKYKIFRWKLLHFILPCNYLLWQWTIKPNNQCILCKQVDDYQHFFMTCNFVHKFWTQIKEILRYFNIDEHICTLKNLVFGYKIADECYYGINLLLTIIGFSIYKAHYLSNQRERKIDVFHTFRNELLTLTDITKLTKIKKTPIAKIIQQFESYLLSR